MKKLVITLLLLLTATSGYAQLNKKVLDLALDAYKCARLHGIKDPKHILTIIDYSLPSTAKRLWVLDLKKHYILFNTLVAHGEYSGTLIPHDFSDVPGSLESSIGLFRTGGTYYGHKGLSLQINGLEKGFNDKAKMRHIVMHGAWYVSNAIIERYGRIGRSWGCPAVSTEWAKPIINTIKNSTLIFVYYPKPKWLKNSRFLHC